MRDNKGQHDTGQEVSAGRSTIADVCERHGVKVDSVRKAWNRAGLSGFDRQLVPTDEQISMVSVLVGLYGVQAKAKIGKTGKTATPFEKPKNRVDAQPKEKVQRLFTRREIGLYAIMAATGWASWQNMSVVTGSLFGDSYASLVVTALFSLSPFVFSLSGLVSGIVKHLVFGIVAFEGFCNLTRIYGGLINFGTVNQGSPTRFLGLVSDIFNTGTHWTALIMAAVMSLFLCGLFLVALLGLKNRE